jgi:hypothetical protein
LPPIDGRPLGSSAGGSFSGSIRSSGGCDRGSDLHWRESEVRAAGPPAELPSRMDELPDRCAASSDYCGLAWVLHPIRPQLRSIEDGGPEPQNRGRAWRTTTAAIEIRAQTSRLDQVLTFGAEQEAAARVSMAISGAGVGGVKSPGANFARRR